MNGSSGHTTHRFGGMSRRRAFGDRVLRGWIPFVAMRHFHTKRREKGHTAGVLSVLGIAAGVLTLLTVVGVMNGFQSGTINDILELNSYHLQVSVSPDAATGRDAGDLDEIVESIGSLPNVREVIPFVDAYGLAIGYFESPRAVMLRAIPFDALVADSELAGILELDSGSLYLEDRATVVIGEDLARRLGVSVGDPIRVANFGAEGANVATPETVELEVTGIFRSGFLEFDGGWGFVSLDAARTYLASGDPGRIGVKLVDRFADRQAASRIAGIAGVERVTSWREYNRAIFGALRLEKVVMMLLVGLIFVVVGVNIYQSLRRSVVERTEEIGVLKALGAGPRPLQTVFVVEGLWIGLSGALIGTMIGLLITANIDEVFRLVEIMVNGVLGAANWIAMTLKPESAVATGQFTIFSPAYFYLEEVPCRVYLGEAIGVFLFAVASAVIAAHFASRRVSAITPAEVLRFE